MLVGVAIVDFMFFGKYLGVLSSTLSFEGGMQFAPAELWGNLLAIAATAGVMYLVYRRWSKHVFKAALAFVLAIAIMLPINIGSIPLADQEHPPDDGRERRCAGIHHEQDRQKRHRAHARPRRGRIPAVYFQRKTGAPGAV